MGMIINFWPEKGPTSHIFSSDLDSSHDQAAEDESTCLKHFRPCGYVIGTREVDCLQWFVLEVPTVSQVWQ